MKNLNALLSIVGFFILIIGGGFADSEAQIVPVCIVGTGLLLIVISLLRERSRRR